MSAGPQRPLAGAAATTADHLGSRHCLCNAQVDPKANGATAARKRCRRTAEPRRVVSRRDVVQCLSCLHRKVPEQFLGEGVLVTAPPYPTDGGLRAVSWYLTIRGAPITRGSRRRHRWLSSS